MAKSKNSKTKEKDAKKKGTKDASKKKRVSLQVPAKPDPFLPYDVNQPRKAKLSLVFDTTLKKDTKDHSLDHNSKSTPIVLPSHKLDDLAAATISFHEIPAFNADIPSKKPHVCIWEYLSKDDTKILVKLRDDKDDLMYFLENKFQESKRGKSSKLLFELLYEAARFSGVTQMNERKTAALLSIIYLTQEHFKDSMWQSAEATYRYVKEAFLLHTVQRPPNSAEIFSPEECRSALLYFCKIYLRHLPLVQLTMLSNYQLRMEWTPEKEISPEPIQETDKQPTENGGKKEDKNEGKKGDKKGDKKGEKKEGKKGKDGKKKK